MLAGNERSLISQVDCRYSRESVPSQVNCIIVFTPSNPTSVVGKLPNAGRQTLPDLMHPKRHVQGT